MTDSVAACRNATQLSLPEGSLASTRRVFSRAGERNIARTSRLNRPMLAKEASGARNELSIALSLTAIEFHDTASLIFVPTCLHSDGRHAKHSDHRIVGRVVLSRALRTIAARGMKTFQGICGQVLRQPMRSRIQSSSRRSIALMGTAARGARMVGESMTPRSCSMALSSSSGYSR